MVGVTLQHVDLQLYLLLFLLKHNNIWINQVLWLFRSYSCHGARGCICLG